MPASGHGALAARHRAAAGLATDRHRGGHRRHRQPRAQAARGGKRLRRRRADSSDVRLEVRKGRADDQLRAEIEAIAVRSSSSSTQISQDLADIPDIRYWFLDDNGKRDVKFIVTGAGQCHGGQCRDRARRPDAAAADGLANVVSRRLSIGPELRIYPRRDLAVRLGVSTESLSETDPRRDHRRRRAGAWRNSMPGTPIVPIRVLLEENARADRQVLEQFRVPLPARRRRAAVAVADITARPGPDQHHPLRPRAPGEGRGRSRRRRAQRRDEGHQGASGDEEPPPGVKVSEAGDAELQAELFEGFGAAMRDGLMMVYAVLVVLFGSFLQPITILFSLPLSIGGAMLALLLTGKPITHAGGDRHPDADGHRHQERHHAGRFRGRGDAPRDRPHDGDHRRRSEARRPIIMTTIAMVAGMAPSALAIGAGGEFRSPMAIAVIGGLIVSTFLSLLFVLHWGLMGRRLRAACAARVGASSKVR